MGKITNNYGELVFNQKEMKSRLSPSTYACYTETLHHGAVLDESIAEDIARAVKEWAIENGATHFTHWFQPQRSGTAEKHDAFINYDKDGGVIEKFSTSQLIQSEPDASSFPHCIIIPFLLESSPSFQNAAEKSAALSIE